MKAKAFAKDVFVNQEQKSEVRRRSDTVIVLTINDADWRSAGVGQSDPAGSPPGNQSLWVLGEVWLQS